MNENSNPTLVIEMSVFMYIARLHPFEEYFTLFPSTACQEIACHLQFYTLIELSIYFTPQLLLSTTTKSIFHSPNRVSNKKIKSHKYAIIFD